MKITITVEGDSHKPSEMAALLGVLHLLQQTKSVLTISDESKFLVGKLPGKIRRALPRA